ncbi:MAG: hypothetical protein FJW96_07880 [Actinobacteria bacterium]|nr:hypothetical protein [Actinomycetota bacterium]
MTSGKVSRKARQTPTPPPKRTPTTGRARTASPRVLAAAAAAFAAIVVAVVLGVVLSGGSDGGLGDLPATGSVEGSTLTGAGEIEELFAGIPQSGLTLGKPDAPVTLVEWLDLQCPACREFETKAFPEIVERWVRTGTLRVEMQPWAFIGDDSRRGRLATIAAGDQDRAFNFKALLYANQGAENAGWLDDEMIGRAAASIPGLKVQQLLDDRGSTEAEEAGAAVDARALADDVTSTPTLFVGRTGEKGEPVQLTSLDDTTPIDEAIEAIVGER